MRMRSRLTVACLQQDILWEQPEANRHLVEEAFAGVEADILIVPETFSTGFSDTMAAQAEEPEGPTLQWARTLAARHDALFVGTWTVKENGLVYNRLHYVYPDGRYGTYDKGHTFRVSSEASQIARGRRRVVFEWRGWRIKPAVCYDLRFPKWLRNSVRSDVLGVMSYDILLVCANWPGSRHEAWTTLLKARAIENLCYVVGCNRCGIDAHGGEYTGNSAVVDYKGFILPGSTMTLDKGRLDAFRQKWPLYLDFD